MQLKTVKTAADLPFKGIELVKVDNQISEVIVGGKLRIRAGQYSGIAVLALTDGEEAKRFRVRAKHPIFGEVTEYLDTDYAAKVRADELEENGATVIREPVTVLVGEAGEVLREANAPAEPALADDLPF